MWRRRGGSDVHRLRPRRRCLHASTPHSLDSSLRNARRKSLCLECEGRRDSRERYWKRRGVRGWNPRSVSTLPSGSDPSHASRKRLFSLPGEKKPARAGPEKARGEGRGWRSGSQGVEYVCTLLFASTKNRDRPSVLTGRSRPLCRSAKGLCTQTIAPHRNRERPRRRSPLEAGVANGAVLRRYTGGRSESAPERDSN